MLYFCDLLLQCYFKEMNSCHHEPKQSPKSNKTLVPTNISLKVQSSESPKAKTVVLPSGSGVSHIIWGLHSGKIQLGWTLAQAVWTCTSHHVACFLQVTAGKPLQASQTSDATSFCLLSSSRTHSTCYLMHSERTVLCAEQVDKCPVGTCD